MPKSGLETIQVTACVHKVPDLLPVRHQIHDIVLATGQRVRVELTRCEMDADCMCRRPDFRKGKRKPVSVEVSDALTAKLAADTKMPILVAKDLEKAEGAGYCFDSDVLRSELRRGVKKMVLITDYEKSADQVKEHLEIYEIDLTGVTIEEVKLANSALQAKAFLVKRG